MLFAAAISRLGKILSGLKDASNAAATAVPAVLGMWQKNICRIGWICQGFLLHFNLKDTLRRRHCHAYGLSIGVQRSIPGKVRDLVRSIAWQKGFMATARKPADQAPSAGRGFISLARRQRLVQAPDAAARPLPAHSPAPEPASTAADAYPNRPVLSVRSRHWHNSGCARHSRLA